MAANATNLKIIDINEPEKIAEVLLVGLRRGILSAVMVFRDRGRVLCH
jgi:hypothetical protein